MIFEKDIFISYAHIDNMPLKEGEKGWVTNFHRALEIRLAQLIGEKPSIWRDQKLHGDDIFGVEIAAQFPKTAVMISILSPRYIKSEWCTKEVKEFYEIAEKEGGVKIGNKLRIFKVVKTYVPYQDHPEVIADTLGYEFFKSDPHSGRMKELNQKCGGELEQLYWDRLNDIAHDIRDLLTKIKQTGRTGIIKHQSWEKAVVYLAETSIELKKQRDLIKRQLIESGYRVLPETRLPTIEAEFEKSVDLLLEQCALSIHMVGGEYGPMPADSHESIIHIQNQLAVEKCKDGKLQRLIWLLPGHYAKTKDPREKEFVQQLRINREFQYGADFFETHIEDFKSAMRDKLENLPTAASFVGKALTVESPASMTVFLAETNYELKDQREQIKQRLLEQGCIVLPTQPLPLFYPELVETVDDLLGQCDISIHLLGADYGIVPDKSEKSMVFIQAQQAAEKSRDGQIRRLVCISQNADHTDERQQAFINYVKDEQNISPFDDIFETPIKQIASTIVEKIKIIKEKRHKKKEDEIAAHAGLDGLPRQIYLICDRKDLEHITELEDLLFESGHDVIIPAFEGEEEALIQDHLENLKSCDAAIIYYGAGNDLWMRAISRDLIKIAGYGRVHPLRVKAVFLAPPITRAKNRFRSQTFLAVNGMKELSPSIMEPIMEELNAL